MKSNTRIKKQYIFSLPDDKQIFATVGEVKKCFEEEFAKREKDMYADVERDVAVQFMATIFTELTQEFGFSKEDLHKVKRGTEGLFSAMLHDGIMGKSFDPTNCVAYLKDNFDIDFDKDEV